MDETTPDTGLSRRDMLRRTALVGGTVVWMAPVVQTLAAPAYAGSTAPGGPPPGNGETGAISYVVILGKCGGTYYMRKYGDTGCGDDVSVSSDDATCTSGLAKLLVEAGANLASSCPPFGAGSDLGGGTCDLTVTLGDCTLEGYLVHDGQLPNKCFYATRTQGSSASAAFDPAKFDPFPTIGVSGDVCFNKK